jgi:hypothetical protein
MTIVAVHKELLEEIISTEMAIHEVEISVVVVVAVVVSVTQVLPGLGGYFLKKGRITSIRLDVKSTESNLRRHNTRPKR